MAGNVLDKALKQKEEVLEIRRKFFEDIAKDLNIPVTKAQELFRDRLQFTDETQGETVATTEPPADPVPGGSGDATTDTPPTSVASAATQPASAPPRRRQGTVMASYNPVSKYGVKLFEARRKFK